MAKYVLLINPPWSPLDVTSNSFLRKAIGKRHYPPLGLAYLASSLEKAGVEVKIIDMQVQEDWLLQAGLGSPDFVGITAMTPSIDSALKVAERAKGLWPDTCVVMGGIHITSKSEDVVGNKYVDYYCQGEGEQTLVKLVDGEWMPTGRVENLDDLPMPAYHLLPMHLYNPPLGGALRTPSISMISSRGCPGECTYCTSASSKKTRFHSAWRMVQEIEHLISNYGIREVTFYDDTFCADRQRIRDFCRLLTGRGVDITWTCFSRIDFADKLTLWLMRKAGCHMICYGIESADKTILKTIKKHLDIDKVIPVVRMTQDAGIRVRLSFMMGLPGDTKETMEKTIRFAIKADPDYAQFLITTPFPGTKMYEWAEKNGYLLTKDWSKYNMTDLVMSLPTVADDDVRHYHKWAYRRFYFRFGFFRRFIVSLWRYPALILHFFRYVRI